MIGSRGVAEVIPMVPKGRDPQLLVDSCPMSARYTANF
jgi:hypothetical protein